MKTAIEIVSERLDVLAGTRARDKTGAAVRIEDLTGLVQFPTLLHPIPLSPPGSPSKAEFDALVRAVEEIRTALVVAALALQERLKP